MDNKRTISYLFNGVYACCLVSSFVEAIPHGFYQEKDYTVPLREWPQLYAHNSATGYLSSSPLSFVNIIQAYAKNHNTGFEGQLQCGARALDFRPLARDDADLVFHHGPVAIEYAVEHGLEDIKQWLKENPTELVILDIKDCDGAGCEERTKAALAAAGIQYTTNCSVLRDLTVSQTKQLGKLAAGGSLYAFFECVEGNYDPSVTCFMFDRRLEAEAGESDTRILKELSHSEYSDIVHQRRRRAAAIESCRNKDPGPFTNLRSHLETVTARNFEESKLTSANGHWQSTSQTIQEGLRIGGSILSDTIQSGVNVFVRDLINNGSLENINLLQVDHVCHNGRAIYNALGSYAVEKGLANFTLQPTTSDGPSHFSRSVLYVVLAVVPYLAYFG